MWRADAGHGAACGDASTVLVDGGDGAWTRTWDLKNLPFYVRSVYGRSMDNIFVVGDNGTIARYGR